MYKPSRDDSDWVKLKYYCSLIGEKISDFYLAHETGITKTFQVLVILFCAILIFAGFMFLGAYVYLTKTFGSISMEQILFTLAEPLGSASGTMEAAASIAKQIFTMPVIAVILALVILFIIFFKTSMKKMSKILIWTLCLSFIFMSINAYKTIDTVDLFGFFERQKHTGEDFYENNYVDASEVDFTFPENKRNLVYIILESMEETFADKKNGGAMKESLIPNLTKIQRENTTFTNYEGLKAPYASYYTAASMVAQTSGTPITTKPQNGDRPMLPGATTITDILGGAGYNQVLLIGSDGSFDSRGQYFNQHGGVEIEDLQYARDQGWIPKDYQVWWGYEDEKLFKFAKNELTRLASEDEPFAFYTLTVDTHFPDGYVYPDTKDKFKDQYKNAIYMSDERVGEFIEWIQKQSWYDNTTIVVTGDHKSMNSTSFTDVKESEYERGIYYAVINPAIEKKSNRKMQATVFDLFPTTLAALGIQASSNQLGFGVNLFSGDTTFVERYGKEEMSNLIMAKSDYYDKNIWDNLEINKEDIDYAKSRG